MADGGVHAAPRAGGLIRAEGDPQRELDDQRRDAEQHGVGDRVRQRPRDRPVLAEGFAELSPGDVAQVFDVLHGEGTIEAVHPLQAGDGLRAHAAVIR